MSENNKVLILDNEEMVLETIEMFYPSEEDKLYTASSLEKAFSILEEEKPSIIVTNAVVKESSGQDLIDKIREKNKTIEIIFMSDLNFFKDILAEFGGDISDVVYKPIDMDILETIIKRAREKQRIKQSIEKFEREKDSIRDENNNLNTKIIELTSKLEDFERENQNFKDQITELGHKSAVASESGGEQAKDFEEKIASLQKGIDEEKKINSLRMNLVVSLINALRKSSSKTTIVEIFSLFEEALATGLKINNVRISSVDKNNAAKINELNTLLTDNKLCSESPKGIEIPLKIGNSFYIITITDKINIHHYSHLIYFLKDALSLISLNKVSKDSYLKQLEKEKNTAKVVSSILANIQLYIKKSGAIEKVQNTKASLAKIADDILHLIFASQEEINKLEDKSKVQTIEANLNKIVGEKSQNFDIISQKLEQVIDMVNNIQEGLKGKRMQQVSGDQYLFSKDRKDI
ncbi:response regulator [Candidatus Auribacterota bacterium]